MYHDQGLTAFKTLSFSNGVNFTAGLNIIRTSPVHGTAYDIAGEGIADEKSFREAVFMACDIYKKRNEFKALNKNPLAFKS
jgi:4-hydroxythreonine-4-phosphate dehydrogenase